MEDAVDSPALQHYFADPQNPMAHSPIGNTMRKVLEKYPDLTPKQAHEWALELHQEAAARKHYIIQVLSPEQIQNRKLALDRFRQSQISEGRDDLETVVSTPLLGSAA